MDNGLVCDFFASKGCALACATDETKLLSSLSEKQCQNPCSRPPAMYQDLSMHHDWPVEEAIVNFPIKRSSGNLLSLSRVLNKDIRAASQTLLTKVKLRL